ncbi:hypothetical protein [Microbacterium testaceum]|uniref:hypothetical protein n=1 Tax=Microbacterium testaceum TaxID=2033 RepID=UPI0027D900AD|nr:hypothetical protein [Microbacterium testaceum]
MILWILGVNLSSLIHSTSILSLAANLYYPVSTIAIAALFIYIVRENWMSIRDVAIFVAIGLIGGSVFGGALSQSTISPLKLGLGLGLAVLVLSTIGGSRRGRFWPALVLIAAATFFVIFDFRSMGAMLFVAAIARVVLSPGTAKSRSSIFVQAGVVCIVSVLAVGGVSLALSSGLFGQEAQMRFESQSDSQAGLLQAARPETIVSTIALRNSWLVGRGYGQSLTGTEASEAVGMYASLGMPLNQVQEDRIIGAGINSHSLLLTTWIATGALGAIGVALLAAHVVRGAVAELRAPSNLAPLILFTAVLVVWDSLFSPWNPRNEVWLGLAVTLTYFSVEGATRVRRSLDRESRR